MSEAPRREPAPVTGHAAVDAATASAADLAGLTPAEQLGRLTEAHEALHRALALDEPTA